MAIPKIKEQGIIEALKYIDEHGVPSHNQSTKYELVTEDGKIDTFGGYPASGFLETVKLDFKETFSDEFHF